MTYRQEKDMYPSVCNWLEKFLRDRHRKAVIQVFDTSRKSLVRLIRDKRLMNNLSSEWQSWDIYVDVVGFIVYKQLIHSAFVECKNTAVTLANVSQLLGYSRVALPAYSFIISPKGISDSLKSLLITFNRLDILQYSHPQGKLPLSISIARWDETAKCIDSSSIITGNTGKMGLL